MLNWRRFMLAFSAAGLLSCGSESRKPIFEFRVWHTETDQDASEFIEHLADSVQANLTNDSTFGFRPLISVSALPWGGLVARIREEVNSPPDLTHVQPFMVPQLVEAPIWNGRFAVWPIEEVWPDFNSARVLPGIASLHRYQTAAHPDSATYGLAYAVGTTFVAFRRDWHQGRLIEPRTWETLVEFADALASNSGATGTSPFILPGRDPFFIAQLVNEMVVSLGGSLYSANGEPVLRTEEVRRVLYIFQEMVARTGGRYDATGYLEQFELYAQGEGAIVPVTYGRATRAIERFIGADSAPVLAHNFAVMAQPGPGSDGMHNGVATIDAEPWITILSTEASPEREARRRVAEAFLTAFYERETYLDFTALIPVHLRPVFVDLEEAYDAAYEPGERNSPWQHWHHWVALSRRMLSVAGRTAPILMDPTGTSGKQRPRYLLDLENRRVLADMVRDAASDEVLEEVDRNAPVGEYTVGTPRAHAIDRAIERAQERAMQLFRATHY